MSSRNQTQNSTLVKLATLPEAIEGKLDDALPAFCKAITETLDVDRVTIWRYFTQSRQLRCITVFDRTMKKPDTVDFLDTHQYANYFSALKTGKPIAVSDVTQDPRTAEVAADYWKPYKISSVIASPIGKGEKLLGVLCCEATGSPRQWNDDDLYFVKQITQLVTQAFHNDTARLRAEQYISLQSIMMDIAAERDLPVLLKTIVEKATHLCNATGGLVYLNDPDQKVVRCAVSYQTPRNYIGVALKYGEGAAGKVAKSGEPLMLDNYHNWPGRADIYKEEQVAAVLSTPMLWKGKITGVIQVFHRQENKRFEEFDLESLREFARQAAVALENTRLYDETHHRAIHEEALHQIISAAYTITDTEELLKITLDHTLKALDLEIGVGALADHLVVRNLTAKAGGVIAKAVQETDEGFTQPQAINDWQNASGPLAIIAPQMKPIGIRASLAAPIMVNEKRFGFICLSDRQAREWAIEEYNLVDTVCSQLSAAIERAIAFQEIQDQSDAMNRLNSVSDNLNRVHSFNDILGVIGEGVTILSDTPRVAIFLLLSDKNIVPSWYKGVTRTYVEQVVAREKESSGYQLFGNPTPVLIPEKARSPRESALNKILDTEMFRSIGVWPLVYEGRVIATVVCYYNNPHIWTRSEKDIMQAFTRQAAVALENAWLYGQLEEHYLQTALALANAMDARDGATVDNERMAQWAEATAQELRLSTQDMVSIHWAALMHDVGKSVAPDHLVKKAGPLTDEEWNIIRRIPVEGQKIILPVARLHSVATLIRHFREKYDGSGYPDGLKGDQIPMGARILAVADAYGAIIDRRAYKPPRTHKEAVQELKRCAGKQFDPQVVEAFLRVAEDAAHPL